MRSTRRSLFLILAATLLQARNVQVEFDPGRPDVGPFPSNQLTVADERQRTGLRVALPIPDCTARPSDCAEVRQLNELDGFSPTPRITVRFSGAIAPETLRDNVFIAWLDPVVAGRYTMYPAGKLSPVNELIWDPATRTAYLKPDEMLEQTRAYLVVITDGVRDAAGDPVEPAPAFLECASGSGSAYCGALRQAVNRIDSTLPGGRRIAAASLFTTLSVTAFLEEARRVVRVTAPGFRVTNPPLDLGNLRAITERRHVRLSGGEPLSDLVLPFPGELLAAFGIGKIAFGSIRSPQFIDPRTLTIAQTPTAEPVTAVREDEVHFHAWLPRTPAPPGGYPVLIAGHGITDTRLGMPTWIATVNSAGIAVLAINAVGHGYGPLTSYRFTMADGSAPTVAAPGRAIDADANGVFTASEGCVVPSPNLMPIAGDCLRQTSVDLMQLVHAVRDGVDMDGDGRVDLNGQAISYLGQSLGGGYGALFAALEPELRGVVLNVAPGSILEVARTTQNADFRQLYLLALSLFRQPSLLNDGAGFADDIPFRNEAVRVRTRAGAAAIQDWYDRMQWIGGPREPQNYGPYLRTATLPGVNVRPLLFQMAWGDATVPNQSTSALIRAANMRELTSLYRHDAARAVVPELLRDPHTHLVPLGPVQSQGIATATLVQAVQFLLGAGDVVPNVNPLVRGAFGRDLFEVPPAALPEVPNFLPLP